MERVHITGTGESTTSAGSLEGMIFESARAALADAGVERSDVDGIVIAASDQVDGRAISSMLTSGPAGAYLNDEINAASSPGHAFALACMQVASRTHRRVLISSWGKATESEGSSTESAERLSTDPFFDRDSGLTRIAAAGLQADIHRRTHADPERAELAAATVAARNHRPGRDRDEVIASAYVAAPLRELEWPVETDGAWSLVIEPNPAADGSSVAVEGIGWCADSGRIANRDLVGVPHLRKAAATAFASAGIADARTEVDIWELHDYTPDAEIVSCVALGLCPAEAAVEQAIAGWPGDGDSAAVNPHGGSVSGEAPFGGPLGRIVRGARYLRGGADSLALRNGRVGVQITTGFAGQFQSTFVLGSDS
jgi:acetyl-CoA C-acetyltransferase